MRETKTLCVWQSGASNPAGSKGGIYKMFCRTGRHSFFCVMTILLTITFVVMELSGQQRESAPITGLNQVKPLVPTMNARELATALELKNLKNRPQGDQGTTGSFIDSLQGEDALIEVIVGRGRLLTFEKPLIKPDTNTIPAIAVGDPTVLDFDLLPNSQMIRVLGKRVGVTDLSVITAEGKTLTFQVQVVYDLNLVRAHMKQVFPNATLNIAQIYEHIVVEGQAANVDQVNQIIQTLQALLTSIQVAKTVKSKSEGPADEEPTPAAPTPPQGEQGGEGEQGSPEADAGTPALDEEKPDITATLPPPQIINLIRVPGVQQVMLQVRVAELNRTVLREVGADLFYQDSSGRTFGTNIAGALATLGGLGLGDSTTAFALIPNGTIDVLLRVLRQNRIINVLAEPNLTAMHGEQASFLAGGEFPVPVPQAGGGGLGATITIEFKEFGVLLNFVPFIMDDDVIRLRVAPEVSTIDNTIGVTVQGTTVPGVNTRRAETTVELRQGQTLALAGLLQVELAASTQRIPGLGDLPYLGPFFSNTSHQKTEKELVILVTPHLVDSMDPSQVGPLPGCEVKDPDDFEFYWLNRLEGQSDCNTFRATTAWDDPLNIKRFQVFEKKHMNGPYGFSK